MHKDRKKRNLIIGSLLAILVIMTVGYAAFSTQLKITGNASITSNWDVQITGISNGTPTGSAENAINPSYDVLTANMEVNLYSPGDSMTYEITIENKGTIDATLSKITKTDTNNPAILFETSGVNEGDNLNAGDKTTMTVKITYNPNITTQPENLTSELNVTLTYEQKGNSSVTPPTPINPTIGGQEVEIVTTGDGLYKDEYEEGKYTYKGTNPNNYIIFNNETWRIISVDSNGLIKIMRNESIGNRAFDETGGTYGNNNWDRPADIKTYLNDTYFPTITTNQDKIVPHTWSIGGVTSDNYDLAGQIADESDTQSQPASIGMITASEYLRANSNIDQCGNMSINNNIYETCKTTNWMQAIVPSDNMLWTISPLAQRGDSSTVFYVFSLIGVGSVIANTSGGVYPTVYLSSDITLTGNGSQGNPYVIS